ncbi:MFS transporter [Nocardioides sp. BP30]|uniref:MFS transporter n=1 Tax=Nocardioides sp. BP30 TaxID=3036374 RepID=UPI0024684EE2|nr:MFS transporter [Nocardioides sp. BP30]WGL51346.1 MFS transporter [Nocardioides sp. BP30]
MSETVAASGAPAMLPKLTAGTLVAAVGACFVAQVGVSIPAVINGYINQDLGTTSTQLTWVSDAFLVPVTLFELTFGVVGDLFGRKRLLAIGSLLMVIGGLFGFFTPSSGVGVLLTGQVIAGLGAAAIFPTSVAMIAAGTHTVRDRAHAISIWAAALTTGGFMSPLIGGLLAKIHHSGGEFSSWRYAFLAMAVLAAVSTAITLVAAQNSSSPVGRSLDWPGQITIAIALFALLFGVIQGAEDGWSSGRVIGSFVAAVVFMVAFVVIERRVDKPLIQLDLFSNRMFTVSAVVTVLGMFAYLGTAYATSIRLSAILNYSPLKTAGGFVLLNIMGVVLFPVSARMLQRYNPGWVLAAGMGLIGVGDVALAALPAASHAGVWVMAIPLLVIGAGFKTAVTAITVVAVNSVPTDKAGMASGATSMLRDFGLTLGPAIVGAIALTNAANAISAKVAGSPKLQSAMEAFNSSAQVPPPVKGAVNSGPLGANAIPAELNPLKDVAFHALSHAYSIGYLVCGIAALVAAVIAALMLGGRQHSHTFVAGAEASAPQ